MLKQTKRELLDCLLTGCQYCSVSDVLCDVCGFGSSSNYALCMCLWDYKLEIDGTSMLKIYYQSIDYIDSASYSLDTQTLVDCALVFEISNFDPSLDQTEQDSFVTDLQAAECKLTIRNPSTDLSQQYHYYIPQLEYCGQPQPVWNGELTLEPMTVDFMQAFNSKLFELTLKADAWNSQCDQTGLIRKISPFPADKIPGCYQAASAVSCEICHSFTKQFVYQVYGFAKQYTQCDAKFSYEIGFTIDSLDANTLTFTIPGLSVLPSYLKNNNLKACSQVLSYLYGNVILQESLRLPIQSMSCTGTLSQVTVSTRSYPQLVIEFTSVPDLFLSAFLSQQLRFQIKKQTVSMDASQTTNLQYIIHNNQPYSQNCAVSDPSRSVKCLVCNPFSTLTNGICIPQITPILALGPMPSNVDDPAEMEIALINIQYKPEIIEYFQYLCAPYLGWIIIDQTFTYDAYATSNGYDPTLLAKDINKMTCYLESTTISNTFLDIMTLETNIFSYPATKLKITYMPKLYYQALQAELIGLQFLLIQDDYQLVEQTQTANTYTLPIDETCEPLCTGCIDATEDQIFQEIDCGTYTTNCFSLTFLNIEFINPETDASSTDCTHFFDVSTTSTPTAPYKVLFSRAVSQMVCEASYYETATYVSYNGGLKWGIPKVVSFNFYQVSDDFMVAFLDSEFTLALKPGVFQTGCSGTSLELKIPDYSPNFISCQLGCIDCDSQGDCLTCSPYLGTTADHECSCLLYHEVQQFSASGATIVISNIGLTDDQEYLTPLTEACLNLLQFSYDPTIDPTVQAQLIINLASITCTIQVQRQEKTFQTYSFIIMESTLTISDLTQLIVDNFFNQKLIIKLNDLNFLLLCSGTQDLTIRPPVCSNGCDQCLSGDVCKVCNPFTIQGLNYIIPTLWEATCDCDRVHQIDLQLNQASASANSVVIKSSGVILSISEPLACTDLFTITSTDTTAQTKIPSISCTAVTSQFTPETYVKTLTVLQITLSQVHDSVISAYISGSLHITFNTLNIKPDCTGDSSIEYVKDSYSQQNCRILDTARPLLCSFCNPLSTYVNGRCKCKMEFKVEVSASTTDDLAELQKITIIGKNLKFKDNLLMLLGTDCRTYLDYYSPDPTFDFNDYLSVSLTKTYTRSMFQDVDNIRICTITTGTATDSAIAWDPLVFLDPIQTFTYSYTKIEFLNIPKLRAKAVESKLLGLRLLGGYYELSMLDYQCDSQSTNTEDGIFAYLMPAVTECTPGCTSCLDATTCGYCNPASTKDGAGLCQCKKFYSKAEDCSGTNSPYSCMKYDILNIKVNGAITQSCSNYLKISILQDMSPDALPILDTYMSLLKCTITQTQIYTQLTDEVTNAKESYFANKIQLQITNTQIALWNALFYQYVQFELKSESFIQDCTNPTWKLDTIGSQSHDTNCLSYADPATKYQCLTCNTGFQVFNFGSVQTICVAKIGSYTIINPLDLNDPCLGYNDLTRQFCVSCKSTHKLLMFSPTRTICGLKNENDNFCTIDTDYYPDIVAMPYPYATLVYQYIFDSFGEYCFNCIAYYVKITGDKYSYTCWDCAPPDGLSLVQKAIYSSSLGCTQCDYDYSNVQLGSLSTTTKFIRDCLDEAAEDIPQCELDEVYKLGKCVKCKDEFPGCAGCTVNDCLFCPPKSYPQTIYDYETKTQKQACLIGACPSGKGIDELSDSCQSCPMENCFQCQLTVAVSVCLKCKLGYYTTGTECLPMANQISVNLFVKSGAPYTNSTVGFDAADYISAGRNGQSPATAFYFFKQALSVISELSHTYKQVDATIFVGEGDHFYFHCDQIQDSSYTYIPTQDAEDIWFNCAELLKIWPSAFYARYQGSDKINLEVKALECNMGSALGYANDADFLDQCVNLKTQRKPRIFINQNSASFNVTSTTTFKNLIFTGINQFVKSVRENYDFHPSMPVQLCKLSQIINGQDGLLPLEAISMEEFINYPFTCEDFNYTGSTLPVSGSVHRCNLNDNATHTPGQQSTLGCPGEPFYHDFFSTNSGNNYYLRRHVLFNLYSYAEHEAFNTNPPTLNIENCEFEHFLKDYESLIALESNNLQKNSYIIDGSEYIYYTSTGGQRGARIWIKDSHFRDSRFCKGLIIYRRQPYIKQTLSFTNLTRLYMSTVDIQDSGSYIFIERSSFTNLNVYTNVTALAMYQGQQQTLGLELGKQEEVINYQTFMHRGIVLNVADFNGPIAISKCTFTRNMHFIPEIFMSQRSSRDIYSYDQFLDSFSTKELKLAICDEFGKDLFFFRNGFDSETDLDPYFDTFERLGLIQISRNKGQVLIQHSQFVENVGTFGGAVTINSPDWVEGDLPYVIVYNNSFSNNMAYFSGNAIYIRNTKLESKINSVCAGVYMLENNFSNNIGMKIHNGGAVSITCQYLSSTSHEDYYHVSSYTSPLLAIDVIVNLGQGVLENIYSKLDGREFNVYKFKVGIVGCNFLQNYSGRKGSALYLRQISQVLITDCEFRDNGPVYGAIEATYSPYFKYLSQRFASYYNEDIYCADEFSFVQRCASQNTFIDWSRLQGAIYVEHCQTSQCMVDNNLQTTIIQKSSFYDNLASPVMDKRQLNTQASSIFIKGGITNKINQVKFYQTKINADQYFIPRRTPTLSAYLPPLYFNYGQASLIRIEIEPALPAEITPYTVTVSNSLFQGHQNYQVLALTSDQQYQGSLFQYTSNYGALNNKISPMVKFSSNQFYDNYFLGSDSSLIFVDNGILQMTSSQFKNNGFLSEEVRSNTRDFFNNNDVFNEFEPYTMGYWQAKGMVALQMSESLPTGYYHQFIGNSFSYTFGNQGTAFNLIIDNQYALFQDNTYNFNFANSGSSLIAQAESGRSTLKFVNEQVSNQYNSEKGAIVVTSLIEDLINVWVSGSTFTNNYGPIGASLNINKGAKALVEASTFKRDSINRQTYAWIGLQFQRINQPLSFFMDQDLMKKFVEEITVDQSVVYIADSLNTQSLAFTLQTIQNTNYQYLQYAELRDCLFYNLQSNSSSGLTISNSKLRIFGTTKFQRNQQSSYGVISLSQSELIGENLIFDSNKALDSVSALYSTDSLVTLSNSQFVSNYASNRALIMVVKETSFTCNNCLFDRNYAYDTSTIHATNIMMQSIRLVNCQFKNNLSYTNLMNLQHAKAQIQSSQFLDNMAQSINHGITMVASELTATNLLVNYTDQQFLNRNNFTADAGFFSMNYKSSLVIGGQSMISNCRGGIASVIFATGASNFKSQGNLTIAGGKSMTGNTVHLSTTNEVVINNTNFINNQLADVYLDRATATITNSRFSQTGNSAILAQDASLNITHCQFDNANNQTVSGKGIYCRCNQLTIRNCTFKNLSGLEGGALYLSSTSKNSTFHISNSTFHNNSAQEGGSIKIADAVKLTLQSNLFLDNQANTVALSNSSSSKITTKAMGGALYYACINENLGLNANCKVRLEKSNVFRGNLAQHDGGAIAWVQNKYLDDGSTSFEDNQAVYGPNVASYPKEVKVEFISNNDYANPINKSDGRRRRFLQGEKLPQINSGTGFSMLVMILDQEGNLYKSDNSSVASLKPSTTSTGTILKNNEIPAYMGVYNFSDVQINMQPGQTSSFTLFLSNLQTFGNNLAILDTPPTFDIDARNCVSGEQYTQDLRCEVCPSGSYLLEPPKTVTFCKSCMDNAYCLGGNKIVPFNGYWRPNNESDAIVQCPVPEYCTYNEETQSQQCAEGYTGIVCGQCDHGYHRVGLFQCQRCPSKGSNSAQLLILILFYICYVSFLVRSNLNEAYKLQPIHSIYLKIMTSYHQMLLIAMNIDYRFPSLIRNSLETNSQPTKWKTEVFSFECFLADHVSKDKVYDYYLTITLYSFLPLLLASIAYTFWYIYSKVKKTKHSMKNYLISTIVILLFLFYPDMTSRIFDSYNCMNINGENRLKDNLAIKCYQGGHLIMMFLVTLPSLIIWVFGIPLFVLKVLWGNKKELLVNNRDQWRLATEEQEKIMTVRQRYGFLYGGYDVTRFYWEVILTFRSLAMSMFIVLLSAISPQIQVQVCLSLVIIMSIFGQIQCKPYFNQVLNNMELYSLICIAITMYFGMFYITEGNYKYMQSEGVKWLMFFCIMVPNFLFILYWAYYMRIEVLKLVWMSKNVKLFEFLSFYRFTYGEFGDKHMQDFLEINKFNENPSVSQLSQEGPKSDPKNNSSQVMHVSDIKVDVAPVAEEERKTSKQISAKVHPDPTYNDTIAQTFKSARLPLPQDKTSNSDDEYLHTPKLDEVEDGDVMINNTVRVFQQQRRKRKLKKSRGSRYTST